MLEERCLQANLPLLREGSSSTFALCGVERCLCNGQGQGFEGFLYGQMQKPLHL